MDILSLRLFLSAVENGSFAGAARAMYMSPATATARLAKLESELGFTLFHRTTRSLSLTTDGAEFLPYAQQTVEVLETGMTTVRGHHSEAKGVLRLSMPSSFGKMYIIPLLAKFQKLHPLITLDLRMSDQIGNMVEEAYDLVIRNSPLNDSSFIARKLAEDERILVASPEYLEEYGTPQSIKDLENHRFVVFAKSTRIKFANGERVQMRNASIVNDGEAMRMLVEQGFGIGLKSLWNVGASLKAGQLVQVLPDFETVTESSLWLLYPSGRMVSPKVRLMIDFLINEFSPKAPWEG